MIKKIRIKSNRNLDRYFSSNDKSLKHSIINIYESESNIPNKLKKYLNQKILGKSYINKLNILLSSNDKKYKLKRYHINQLSSYVNDDYKEYLCEFKKNDISSSQNLDYFGECQKIEKRNQKFPILISKNKINEDFVFLYDNNNRNEDIPTFLMDNLGDFRTPEVIINNEHVMLKYSKRKKILSNIPYLSRNRNDFIIYDYKRKKNAKSKSCENIFKNSYDYLKNYFLNNSQNKTKTSLKQIQSFDYRNTKKKKQFDLSDFIKDSKKKIIIKKNVLPSIVKRNKETKKIKNMKSILKNAIKDEEK
jgi:hypothetical protein